MLIVVSGSQRVSLTECKKETNMTMNDEELKQLYRHLVDHAFMTMDLNPYWRMTVPAWLYHCDLTCNDGTKVHVCMMEDVATSTEERDIYLWVKHDDKFLEFPLYCSFSKAKSWFAMMKETEERALEVLSEIVDGGKDYMTTQIAENGITWEMTLAITEKRMEDIIKLPCSCALSVNGQVFHGIEGIEKYCQEQRDGSSPYILKRCHELPCMEQEDDYLGQRFARNYLLCKDKSEAECFMKTFIGIRDVSALEPDNIPTPAGFPPLICYVDRSRYFVLSYREGEN